MIKLISANGIISENDWLIVAVIRKISLIKLIVGGAAIFAQHPINHQNEIAGIKDRSPFVSVTLRVMVMLYVILAKQNIADDLNPCAIIIDRLACIPIFVPDIAPANINAMCPIDEYAINDFISDWRKQISDVITPPISEIEMIDGESSLFM